MRIDRFTYPPFLAIAPVLLSLLVWVLVKPLSAELSGYSVRSSISVSGVIFIVSWYVFVWMAAVLGFRSGERRQCGVENRFVGCQREERRLVRFVLFALLGLSSVGVAYTVVVAGVSFTSLNEILTSGQGNQFKKSLGSEAGLATLRYTAILLFPMSIVAALKGYVSRWLALMSFVMLLSVSVVSSRLSLMMSLIVLLFLLSAAFPGWRLRWKPLLVASICLVVLLVLLNLLRNGAFYRAQGVTNPFLMNVHQVGTYLGSPMQVSVGIASHLGDPESRVQFISPSIVWLFSPTFLRSEDSQLAVASSAYQYRDYVDVMDSLTTNSAFADLIAVGGLAALPVALLFVGSASFVIGRLSHKWWGWGLCSGVLGYSLLEIWRIFLFAQGIVIYLLVVSAVLCTIGTSRMERRKGIGCLCCGDNGSD